MGGDSGGSCWTKNSFSAPPVEKTVSGASGRGCWGCFRCFLDCGDASAFTAGKRYAATRGELTIGAGRAECVTRGEVTIGAGLTECAARRSVGDAGPLVIALDADVAPPSILGPLAVNSVELLAGNVIRGVTQLGWVESTGE